MKHPGFAAFVCAAFALLSAFPGTVSAEKILRYTDHEPYGNMRTQFIKQVFFVRLKKSRKAA